MIRRLLAIDDEPHWLENFRRWIPSILVEQHSASTTEEAVFYLRRYHYDIVLLDLSMNSDPANRDNKSIQNYLSTQPEGTNYFIVSGTAKITEVIDAAYARNAAWIALKQKIEPAVLEGKIQNILDDKNRHALKLTADDRIRLVGDLFLETQLITTLGIGAQGFSQMLDTLLHKVSPLAQHIYRPKLEIRNRTAVGLFWSRQRGKALSMSFANASVTPEEQARELGDWLGYTDRKHELEEKIFYKKVRVQVFAEPNISDDHFELPRFALD